jgi:hypothetical protein
MFSTGDIVKIGGMTLEVESVDAVVVTLRRVGSVAKARWICRADGSGFRQWIR